MKTASINLLTGFFNNKKVLIKKLKNILTKTLKMTTEDEQKYQNSQDCWTCSENIDPEKVRDHCHVTANYGGAAHNQCNLKPKIPK